jgi:altronate dehydratase large subunit
MARRSRFMGYAREDGSAGTRNHVLALCINGLAQRAAQRIALAVPGTLLVGTPNGRGQYGTDKAAQLAQLVGLGRSPNAAAVLVVGVDRKTAEEVAHGIAVSGKPVRVVALDDTHEDALALSAVGIRAAGDLVHRASRLRRESCDVGALFLGVECGHSDATSGIVANPVVGSCVDRIVDDGGSAVIGEAIEWLGAEDLVARRAADPATGAAIRAAVLRRERAVAAAGLDLTGDNPGQENIRGGLSTIEEKSMGAIAKTGSRPVTALLGHGERPAGKGLHLMDGPSFSPESLTGFAAAGAQVALFTTGPGNSFCSALMPTIKVTGHPETAARLAGQIDFDASPVFHGRESVEAAGERLAGLVAEIASGALTWGEVHGEGAEVLTRLGPSM